MDFLIQDSEYEYTLNPTLEPAQGVWITVGKYSVRVAATKVELYPLGLEEEDPLESFLIPHEYK